MGLYDRDYMRSKQSGPAAEPCTTKQIWIIVAINIFFYFFATNGSVLYTKLSLIPHVGDFLGFQVITSAFLHFDFCLRLFAM